MEDIVTFQGNIDTLAGRTVYDNDGHRIGTVGQVFVMQGTEDPTWVTVQTGLFGMHESFVPMADATERGDELLVPYDKAMIKDAPRIDQSSELTVEQEHELYRYYGVQPPMRPGDAGGHPEGAGQGAAGHGAAGHAAAGLAGAGAGLAGAGHGDDLHTGHREGDGVGQHDLGRHDTGQHDAGLHEAGQHDAGLHLAGQHESPRDVGVAHDSGQEHHRLDAPAGGGAHASGAASNDGTVGGPRLRRRIVTEMQTVQVPVQREEVYVEGDELPEQRDGDRRH